jgi:DNA-binding winged helix-turn-helix (wHTH) protein
MTWSFRRKVLEVSMSNPASYSYVFGSFRLSIAEKKLYSEGHTIPLSTVQFDTLRILVEHEGKVAEKDALARRVCGKYGAKSSSTIEKAIYDLRGKLHDSAHRSNIIQTEREIGGYRIVPTVKKVRDEDLDNQPDEIRPTQIESESKTTQLEVENVSTEPSRDGTITFWELWRGPNEVVRWALILGVLLTIALSTALLFSSDTRKWSRLFVSITQASVLLAALVGSLSGPKGFSQIKDDSYEIAKDASERSIKYWRSILFTWVLFYVVLAFQVHPGIEPPPGNPGMDYAAWKIFSILSDLINNINTLFFILCYDVLHRPIDIRKGKPTIGDSRLYIGLAFILVFLALEIFSVMASSSDNIKAVLSAWSLGSGIVGGIAVALFVGRLQSMFLGPPRSLIIALYSYIAIQPLYVHFGGHQNDAEIRNAVILINAALILKCLLYFYLALLFKSGRLLFYLVLVRRTYDKVGAEWQNFQQDLEDI